MFLILLTVCVKSFLVQFFYCLLTIQINGFSQVLNLKSLKQLKRLGKNNDSKWTLVFCGIYASIISNFFCNVWAPRILGWLAPHFASV